MVYAALLLWGIASMLGTVLIFFPYQKALRILSQNLMGSTSITVAMDNPSFGFANAQVSRIVVGHVAVEGKTFFELKKIDARWYPFYLLAGKLVIFCRALAYDGTIECSIDGIPVFAKGKSRLGIKFVNVNLAKYPEATLPWFKGMSGKLSGWIKEEVSYDGSNKQNGTFLIAIAAGEIKGMQITGLESFVLPYKKIAAEGRISGSKIYLDKILIDGENIVLKGNGHIDRSGQEPNVNLRLAIENSSGIAPLANASVITVTGNQWHPTITISTEPGQQEEKTAALDHVI